MYRKKDRKGRGREGHLAETGIKDARFYAEPKTKKS